MSFRFYASIITLCLLAPGASLAAGSQQDFPIYGGFALGFASASDTNCAYYDYNCDGNDTAFKVYGGKRVHENLAIEAAYYDLGTIKNKGSLVTRTASTDGFNLSVLGIIPVSGLGFFYGKAGVMAWEADYTRTDSTTSRSSDDGTDFTYGAGFAFVFEDKYEFRIEYERLNELGDEYTSGGTPLSTFNFAGSIYFN